MCRLLRWLFPRIYLRRELQILRQQVEKLEKDFSARLDAVYAILKALKMKLWVPEAPVVVYYEEDNMAQRIHFDVRLYPPVDADVVSRLVTIKVTGTDSTVRVLYDEAVDPRAEVLGRYWGYEDEVVTVTLIDVDDAGNRSEAVEVSYQLPDLTAPAKPVAPEIVVVGTDSDFPPPVDVPVSDEPHSDQVEGVVEEVHASPEDVHETSEVVEHDDVVEELAADEAVAFDVEDSDEHVEEVVSDEEDTHSDDEDERV